MPRKPGKARRQGAARPLRNDFLVANYAAAVAVRLRKEGSFEWQGGSDTDLFWRFAEKVDPTGKEKDKPFRYLKWACIRYLENETVLSEDLYKIGEDLELFEDKKKRGLLKGEKADIQRYTIESLAGLAMELRGGALDGFDDMLAKAPAPVMQETTILYRGPEGIALVPHSREAAIYWSRGTRWCTGAENGNNMFFHYNNRGPIVILFTAAGRERYQGHVDSPIMNAQDREAVVNPDLSLLLEQIDGRFLKKEFRSPLVGQEDWNSRDYVLMRVRRDGMDLQYASWRWRSDREVVFEAVRQCGSALGHASWRWRNNREIVLESVRKRGWALEYASWWRRNDRKVALEAVRGCARALEYVGKKLRADREIVLEAVCKDGTMLKYASKGLQADRALVFDAVRRRGCALKYASKELQADREVVFDAVRTNGCALEYASNALQADREVVLEAVRANGYALKYASNALQADREVVLEAVLTNGYALKYASNALQADREIVSKAVQRCGSVLECASPELREDPELQRISERLGVDEMGRMSHKDWAGIDPVLKQESFVSKVGPGWGNLAYAADYGIIPDLAKQQDAFVRGRKEEPQHLVKALHIFPILRDEWKKRALGLDEAAVMLGLEPVPAPVMTKPLPG